MQYLIASSAILLSAQLVSARNPAKLDVSSPHGSSTTTNQVTPPAVTPGHTQSDLTTGFYNVTCAKGMGFARLQTITKTIGNLRQMVIHAECASTGSQVDSAGATFNVIQSGSGIPSLDITLTQPITFQLVGGESCIVQVNGISFITPNSVHSHRPGFKQLIVLKHNRYQVPLNEGTQMLQEFSFNASGDTSRPCHRITADVNEIQINGSFVGIATNKTLECGDCEL